MGFFLKLFPFIIPQVAIETIAARKTELITWGKGWSWYHSVLSLMGKLLLCRLIISLIRLVNNKDLSVKDNYDCFFTANRLLNLRQKRSKGHAFGLIEFLKKATVS